MAPDGPALADEANDADLALRHVTHRFPDDLARALLPDARDLTECVWLDTQVTSRDRRMDKNLFVVADGIPRVEHVEWQSRWTRDLPLRMFEYHALTTLALHGAAKEGERVPRVRSTVVLLDGRRADPWPTRRRFVTAPAGDGFSGLRMHVEAVYQRTVTELAARRSPLWMVFSPLAADATPDAMREVLRALRQRTTKPRYEELAVAMTVLADADGRRRGLREIIAAQLPEELVMQSWVYAQGRQKGLEEGLERGMAQGIEKGIEKGIERGIEKGIERGIEKGRLDSLRQSIELALSTRGLRLSAARLAQINNESRVEVLQRWFTRAITAERASDVFAEAR